MGSTQQLLLICVVILASTHLSFSATQKCNPTDRKILLKINKDFGNPYVLSSWNTTIDRDCCNWYCLSCDLETNRVTELFITVGDLSGPIPDSIGELQTLKLLRLHKQQNLTGPIPSALAKLKNLSRLDISWTNVSGPVPEFISDFNLTFLDLSFNNLSGSIPSSLSKLESLNTLYLDRNKLTGTIPDSIGEFKQEIYLELSHNQLSGPIPETFTKLDLFSFNVSYNKLSGQIPVGGDLQNWDEYSYFHNKNLCGAPLESCKS
ncbi:hypothetical protein ACFE04_001498 [Oxalis oulophora]